MLWASGSHANYVWRQWNAALAGAFAMEGPSGPEFAWGDFAVASATQRERQD